MISISENAQKHFINLLSQQAEGTRIRVFVVNPGTAKAECGVSYCPPDAIESDDIEIPFDGFSAMVDADSKGFLEDAEIDFTTDQMGSQLTLKAPNAKLRKVADDASLFERVHYFLQAEVNPQLAGHGGECTLVEITDDGYAVLQFGGGCNGCAQIDVTVKDGIEKQLVDLMGDEIKGVKDATEHERGDHSYY
ncbi:MAG: Fe-S biogenesis protein NfuA [Colwellia sp.]|uniref:Fe-S biogenesis protein NfuA n=1 Tax=Colwellia sp. TaxID=56799 RepID=UPI001DBFCD92|nr:Fe-S biogenesis protein NfuA [Colwellia sp.]MCJ8293247.1 Fe-S biogenesis protein NfuA [Colwellia sp.]NQY48863.1 Fe-S biogenesis protein NfuA [Colwellia sp.]NQZ27321.1 Fe-S biogenesis protein NfuA [Colwellia sp.]